MPTILEFHGNKLATGLNRKSLFLLLVNLELLIKKRPIKFHRGHLKDVKHLLLEISNVSNATRNIVFG